MTDDQIQTIKILERFITMRAISNVYIQSKLTDILCKAQMTWALNKIKKKMPKDKHDVLIYEIQEILDECTNHFEENGVPPKIDDYELHVPVKTRLRLKDFVIRNNFSII